MNKLLLTLFCGMIAMTIVDAQRGVIGGVGGGVIGGIGGSGGGIIGGAAGGIIGGGGNRGCRCKNRCGFGEYQGSGRCGGRMIKCCRGGRG